MDKKVSTEVSYTTKEGINNVISTLATCFGQLFHYKSSEFSFETAL